MRFKKFDLNLLVALDALLTERSVTKAAARLHLSPSATSDALARLRSYFDDPLLVQVGRRMDPTPRAESLHLTLRDLLVQLDSTITARPSFDPATSDRAFRLFTSDYTQMVLGPALMTLAAQARSTARFDFLPQVAQPQRDLERGDADLLILPQALMSPDHPYEALYEEHFVCVTWSQAALAREPIDADRYFAAGHVLMRPPASSVESAYVDRFVLREGPQRRIAATSYGFATVAPLLVGTELVATMHAGLAQRLARAWPLAIRPCPIDVPPMVQAMQWHRHRVNDAGLDWLRALLRMAVQMRDAAQTPEPDVAPRRGRPAAPGGSDRA